MPAAKRNSIAVMPQARPSLEHSKAVAAAPSTRSTRKSLGATVAPSPLPTLLLSSTTSSRPITRSLIRASLDGSSVISYGSSSSSSTVSSLVSTATASTTPSHARDTLASSARKVSRGSRRSTVGGNGAAIAAAAAMASMDMDIPPATTSLVLGDKGGNTMGAFPEQPMAVSGTTTTTIKPSFEATQVHYFTTTITSSSSSSSSFCEEGSTAMGEGENAAPSTASKTNNPTTRRVGGGFTSPLLMSPRAFVPGAMAAMKRVAEAAKAERAAVHAVLFPEGSAAASTIQLTVNAPPPITTTTTTAAISHGTSSSSSSSSFIPPGPTAIVDIDGGVFCGEGEVGVEEEEGQGQGESNSAAREEDLNVVAQVERENEEVDAVVNELLGGVIASHGNTPLSLVAAGGSASATTICAQSPAATFTATSITPHYGAAPLGIYGEGGFFSPPPPAPPAAAASAAASSSSSSTTTAAAAAAAAAITSTILSSLSGNKRKRYSNIPIPHLPSPPQAPAIATAAGSTSSSSSTSSTATSSPSIDDIAFATHRSSPLPSTDGADTACGEAEEAPITTTTTTIISSPIPSSLPTPHAGASDAAGDAAPPSIIITSPLPTPPLSSYSSPTDDSATIAPPVPSPTVVVVAPHNASHWILSPPPLNLYPISRAQAAATFNTTIPLTAPALALSPLSILASTAVPVVQESSSSSSSSSHNAPHWILSPPPINHTLFTNIRPHAIPATNPYYDPRAATPAGGMDASSPASSTYSSSSSSSPAADSVVSSASTTLSFLPAILPKAAAWLFGGFSARPSTTLAAPAASAPASAGEAGAAISMDDEAGLLGEDRATPIKYAHGMGGDEEDDEGMEEGEGEGEGEDSDFPHRAYKIRAISPVEEGEEQHTISELEASALASIRRGDWEDTTHPASLPSSPSQGWAMGGEGSIGVGAAGAAAIIATTTATTTATSIIPTAAAAVYATLSNLAPSAPSSPQESLVNDDIPSAAASSISQAMMMHQHQHQQQGGGSLVEGEGGQQLRLGGAANSTASAPTVLSSFSRGIGPTTGRKTVRRKRRMAGEVGGSSSHSASASPMSALEPLMSGGGSSSRERLALFAGAAVEEPVAAAAVAPHPVPVIITASLAPIPTSTSTTTASTANSIAMAISAATGAAATLDASGGGVGAGGVPKRAARLELPATATTSSFTIASVFSSFLRATTLSSSTAPAAAPVAAAPLFTHAPIELIPIPPTASSSSSSSVCSSSTVSSRASRVGPNTHRRTVRRQRAKQQEGDGGYQQSQQQQQRQPISTFTLPTSPIAAAPAPIISAAATTIIAKRDNPAVGVVEEEEIVLSTMSLVDFVSNGVAETPAAEVASPSPIAAAPIFAAAADSVEVTLGVTQSLESIIESVEAASITTTSITPAAITANIASTPINSAAITADESIAAPASPFIPSSNLNPDALSWSPPPFMFTAMASPLGIPAAVTAAAVVEVETVKVVEEVVAPSAVDIEEGEEEEQIQSRSTNIFSPLPLLSNTSILTTPASSSSSEENEEVVEEEEEEETMAIIPLSQVFPASPDTPVATTTTTTTTATSLFGALFSFIGMSSSSAASSPFSPTSSSPSSSSVNETMATESSSSPVAVSASAGEGVEAPPPRTSLVSFDLDSTVVFSPPPGMQGGGEEEGGESENTVPMTPLDAHPTSNHAGFYTCIDSDARPLRAVREEGEDSEAEVVEEGEGKEEDECGIIASAILSSSAIHGSSSSSSNSGMPIGSEEVAVEAAAAAAVAVAVVAASPPSSPKGLVPHQLSLSFSSSPFAAPTIAAIAPLIAFDATTTTTDNAMTLEDVNAPAEEEVPPPSNLHTLLVMGVQEDGGVYDRHVTYKVSGQWAGEVCAATTTTTTTTLHVARRYKCFATLHSRLLDKLTTLLVLQTGGEEGSAAGGFTTASIFSPTASTITSLIANARYAKSWGVSTTTHLTKNLSLVDALEALSAFPFPPRISPLKALFLRPLAPTLLTAPEVKLRASAFSSYLKLLESTGLTRMPEVQQFMGVVGRGEVIGSKSRVA